LNRVAVQLAPLLRGFVGPAMQRKIIIEEKLGDMATVTEASETAKDGRVKEALESVLFDMENPVEHELVTQLENLVGRAAEHARRTQQTGIVDVVAATQMGAEAVALLGQLANYVNDPSMKQFIDERIQKVGVLLNKLSEIAERIQPKFEDSMRMMKMAAANALQRLKAVQQSDDVQQKVQQVKMMQDGLGQALEQLRNGDLDAAYGVLDDLVPQRYADDADSMKAQELRVVQLLKELGTELAMLCQDSDVEGLKGALGDIVHKKDDAQVQALMSELKANLAALMTEAQSFDGTIVVGSTGTGYWRVALANDTKFRIVYSEFKFTKANSGVADERKSGDAGEKEIDDSKNEADLNPQGQNAHEVLRDRALGHSGLAALFAGLLSFMAW